MLDIYVLNSVAMQFVTICGRKNCRKQHLRFHYYCKEKMFDLKCKISIIDLSTKRLYVYLLYENFRLVEIIRNTSQKIEIRYFVTYPCSCVFLIGTHFQTLIEIVMVV